MDEVEIEIGSVDETEALGAVLAGLLRPGDVVGLAGDLGAGKTTLAAAVARGLGVPSDSPITSPTFAIVHEHAGSVPVYHLDLYRLYEPAELYDLGVWEYYDGDGVCLVEWCDRFEDLWPLEALVIRLELMDGERRRALARGRGRGREIAEALASAWSRATPR